MNGNKQSDADLMRTYLAARHPAKPKPTHRTLCSAGAAVVLRQPAAATTTPITILPGADR
jgi:hypothetical protein